MPHQKKPFIQRVVDIFGRLPLPFLHFLGGITGWIFYLALPRPFRLARQNLRASGLFSSNWRYYRALLRNIVETGKSLTESIAIWQSDEKTLMSWVRGCEGWSGVEAALDADRGVIFLTPHLGCFEITSLFYTFKSGRPISVLYRPPRQKWLHPLVLSGRARGQVKLAPTTGQGIRELIKALKAGEAIGILPDQIPGSGEGEWADFFGRPAYTMTLASRLAEKTGAAVFMAFGKRLSWGRGFDIIITRLADGYINTPAGLNQALEAQIRQCPEQYLWNYHRYKVRRGTAG